MQTKTWADQSVRASLAAVRREQPFTFGLTNYIAANLSANMVLAIGGSPAIGAMPHGSERFAAAASGMWINLAALITDSEDVIRGVAASASASGTPWVLDPVTVGAGIPENDAFARELLDLGPAIVRGNASEIIALAGGVAATRGVDSTASPEEAGELAVALAQRTGAVVAVSGATDLITDGHDTVLVPGGHVLLTRVTATGCGLGAMTAAFAGSGLAPLAAATASHAVLAEAAARAGATAGGTGTFLAGLLDELSNLGR